MNVFQRTKRCREAHRHSPSLSIFVQPKLRVNNPGDPYEREADAVADKIMLMTNHENINQPFFKPAISFLQRKSQHSEEEEKKMQCKERGSISNGYPFAAIEQTLQSGGEPLDHSTGSYMEQRFGFDFSHVRIHNDALAHQSSKDINALAYTNQSHIVFGAGQYQPQTDSGKRLLAHELTHIIQQQQCGGNMIQREFVYKDPSPREKDPIPIVYEQEKGSTDKAKTSMGLTTPTFNGKKLSEMSEHDLSGLFVLKAPGKEEKGKVQCSVDSSVINAEVSAEELIITQSDKNHQWKGSFRDHHDNSCKEKSNIQVVLNDTTAGKDLYDIILKNENDHVNDLKKIIAGTNKFLGSIDKFSATGKDEKDCNGKLIAKINKTANPALGMANEFLKSWQASVAVWDKGKHTIKKDPASISKNCTKIELNLHQ